MSPSIQRKTEQAVRTQIDRLHSWAGKALQGAAIITNVGSGEIAAVVGDRNPRYSGFNRALDAERQIGSLVKPFVYLTALMQSDTYQWSTLIEDEPLDVTLADGSTWSPQNFKDVSHGLVPLYQALAFSYNQATARLGIEVGIKPVAKTLKEAGLHKTLHAYPSLLLGAPALTPLEVSHVYHTLAADGIYTPLRAIRDVLDASNTPIQRYPLTSQPRFSSAHSHLIHYGLQATMRIGTGRSAYKTLPTELITAGKTGTSNDQRDSWFAGYSGDHLGVVWVGNDDNTPTPLTGSTGALPIWSTIFANIHTRGISQATPEAIEYYWIDNQNGLRSAEGCEGAILIPFIIGTEPQSRTNCDRIGSSVKQWFKRLFQ